MKKNNFELKKNYSLLITEYNKELSRFYSERNELCDYAYLKGVRHTERIIEKLKKLDSFILNLKFKIEYLQEEKNKIVTV